MKAFVNKIVEYIDEHGLNHQHVCIVVPSERMISYLQRAFYEFHQKPILSPKIVTIDRWIQDVNPLPVLDKTSLLFELYEIFKADPVEINVDTFDSFMAWGQTILSDFDEIDRYMIAPDQLFKNLRDIREIENWSFNSEELSKGQIQFMAFWDKLKPYYVALDAQLKEKGVTTKGKAYRYFANQIERAFHDDKDIHFVFAGFNALSESEISLMKQLVIMGRGHILMDSDQFYFNDSIHEAGQFQRELCKRLELKSLPFIENHLISKEMNVRVVECPQFTSQAQVVGSELKKLTTEQLNETLVLLADESLLSSILKHLPTEIEQANITVGLPLRQTSLRSWVDLIFRLQESFLRRGNSSIYYRDFIQFAHHPFILGVLSSTEKKEIQDIESRIINHNWHFLDRKKLDLSERLSELNQLIFEPWKQDWLKGIRIIQLLNEKLDLWLEEKNELERAIIRRFASSTVVLQNIMSKNAPEMSISSFRMLFNGNWSNETIAYFGNPLEGLQIMGLLETRGLDFKRVFVFGLNEGAMPPQNAINTVIPMDLRKFFGLPTPREKQGLFAHHFYRLLHSTDEMLITYSSASEAVGSSEPSRYIQQMELELAQVNPGIRIQKSYYTAGNKEKIGNTVIHKTDEVVNRIYEVLRGGISFSMLDKFMTCPLDFYYRYVLRFGEENKVEEDIESSTLGTIIHYVLETLFEPFIDRFDEAGRRISGKVVTEEDLARMEKGVPLLVSKSFEIHFSEDKNSWQTGTNHINFEVAKEMVQNVLRRDRTILKENPEKALFIRGLETKLETTIALEDTRNAGKVFNVRLSGICDRIDQFDGVHRIIDYKSGSVNQEKVELRKTANQENYESAILINKRKGSSDQKHVLQLLIYCYLYYKSTGILTDKAGIFSFRSIKESPHFLKLPDDIRKEDIPELLERILKQTISDMLDKRHPFVHNKDSKYCAYCN
ncbi:PD-(D/E)XK nuclease family protein [Fluviicola sp.]|uniref:PD-(D/E)XK nuclease family protein n=1 Tax=Fluviicola sp. TaxID=1917219 RepID=UPI002635525B|nr:PD-(D/E)XK nuclease family protein [Fluviicola sp.]